MADFKAGDRVRLREALDVFHLGSFPAGSVGTLIHLATGKGAAYGDLCLVRFDDHFPELDEWNNELEVGLSGDEEALATLDDFDLDDRQAEMFAHA